MKKKLLLAVMIITLLPLASSAGTVTAQERIVVWHALADTDTRVLSGAADTFSQQSGVEVELRYVEPPLLYESVLTAQQSGEGPDVIIADDGTMEPLLAANLIAPVRGSGEFFLADLLNKLPALAEDRCGQDSVTSCLWPQTSPVLSLPELNNDAAERTADWLCEASPWMPFCRGGGLSGVAVSWWFNVFLLNTSWLAQQGIEPPTTFESMMEVRSENGLNVVEARSGDVPLAEDAGLPQVFMIPSTLMVDDPNGVMRSMGSFAEAGYSVVLELRVDAAFVTAASPNANRASEFIAFLQQDTATLAALMDSSQRFPAFDADTLRARRDTTAGLTTLQALVTLAGYAGLAF